MSQRFRALEELGEQFQQLSRPGGEVPLEPGRLRVRRRWRPTALAAVVAVLLAGSAAAAVTVTLTDGTAPVRAPGGLALCPVDQPFLADASTRLVYPPNFPGVAARANARAVTCFDTEQAARRAGYSVAPTPRGDAKLGPLYFSPSSRSVLETCRRAQSFTRAVIFCPTRLPPPWTTPALTEGCPTSACTAPLLSISGGFTAPGVDGADPTTGNLILWAASTAQERRFPYLTGCQPRQSVLLRRSMFRGHPAAWYRCSVLGRNQSIVLEWRIGHEHYGVGADSPLGMRRRLVAYVATHMVATRSLSRTR